MTDQNKPNTESKQLVILLYIVIVTWPVYLISGIMYIVTCNTESSLLIFVLFFYSSKPTNFLANTCIDKDFINNITSGIIWQNAR